MISKVDTYFMDECGCVNQFNTMPMSWVLLFSLKYFYKNNDYGGGGPKFIRIGPWDYESPNW